MLLDDDCDSQRGGELAKKIVDQLSRPIYYKSSLSLILRCTEQNSVAETV